MLQVNSTSVRIHYCSNNNITARNVLITPTTETDMLIMDVDTGNAVGKGTIAAGGALHIADVIPRHHCMYAQLHSVRIQCNFACEQVYGGYFTRKWNALGLLHLLGMGADYMAGHVYMRKYAFSHHPCFENASDKHGHE